MDKVFRGIDINGSALEVKVNAGVIKEVSPIEYSHDLPRILPVLVDIQQNGALTHAYNNTTEESVPELQRIAAHLKKNCVGRVLASLIGGWLSEPDVVGLQSTFLFFSLFILISMVPVLLLGRKVKTGSL